MTICTIDVHSRDVVNKFIQSKLETASAFQWQSQLRHRWDDHEKDCFANICDAQFLYSHEYLGNTPRLVITPLTDRCYITLTQSLHLVMGGGPAGIIVKYSNYLNVYDSVFYLTGPAGTFYNKIIIIYLSFH